MVRSRFPEVAVAAHPFYLKLAEAIGYKPYHAISERTWLAESVYAALLFPDRHRSISALFRREAAGNRDLPHSGFDRLTARVRDVSEDWLRQTDWGRFGLVGFSSVLSQFTACLYFIRRIKEVHPSMTIVIGGSAFSADSGKAALGLFPEIDTVVCGEGELPLLHIVQHHVLDGCRIDDMPPAHGILTRSSGNHAHLSRVFFQMENLDNLPHPDFEDYFEMLSGFESSKRFFPTLPVEVSRGCWWQRDAGVGNRGGCAFCNLNLQWRGYRAKTTRRAVSEIDALTRRHKTLSLALVDNVLPKDSAIDFLKALAGLNKDLSIFAEIRATTSLAELEWMAAAGLRTLQVGIEALSTRLLRRLGKGTTAIHNLEIMKHCEGLGIANLANIIAQFPGSDEIEIRETLNAIEYARIFRPLKLVNFWLGLGSPVSLNPGKFGIRSLGNHPNWRILFPDSVAKSFTFMIQSYRGDIRRQLRIWRPVREKIKEWEKGYARLHPGPLHEPILSYRDGGDFLIVRERRQAGDYGNHRLEGASRSIYLFCERHRPLKRIRENFPRFSEDKITQFLKRMTAEKLMFAEGQTYLSLAVPERVTRVFSSRGA